MATPLDVLFKDGDLLGHHDGQDCHGSDFEIFFHLGLPFLFLFSREPPRSALHGAHLPRPEKSPQGVLRYVINRLTLPVSMSFFMA
jgi:hypothetical protein